jgi:hypothetical protein
VVAVIALLVTIVIGMVAREVGLLQLVSLETFYSKWLHYSEWEFKKNALYHAGKHLTHNRTLINRKGYAAAGMTVTFLIEIVALAMWIGGSVTTS